MTSGRSAVLASRVVGRDVELGSLREALDAASRGDGSMVFLVGEAGIGKSRLAQVMSNDAVHRGLPVLQGRAVQAAIPAAYRPLAEALCSAVRANAVPEAAELAPFRTILSRLIPEWRVDERDPVDDSVVALAEAVLRVLRATAGDRGCLLVLEDLHWADSETLTVVEYLSDNLGSERVLCLVTIRDHERSPGLELAGRLGARRAAAIVELSRLTPEAVADMVGSCLDAATVPDPVLSYANHAEGVPFLVEELLAGAVSSGSLVEEAGSWTLLSVQGPMVPRTFAESVRHRLAVLGAESRAMLAAAAVLGRRFDWSLLPAITDLDEATVLAALHAAVDAQIVAVDAAVPVFRFRHALSRDAVLAELLPPERASLSRRALEVIEISHPVLPGGWCQLAADLACGAGDRRRAAELLLEAGRRALLAGALGSAEATLERARAVAPEQDSILAMIEDSLVDVLSLAGKRDRTVEVGESLLARSGRDDTLAALRGLTHLRLARAAAAATRWHEARDHLGAARREAATAGDQRLSCRVDALDALAALGEDNPKRAAPLANAALAAAERLNLPEVACEALEVIGRCHRPYDLAEAEAAFRRAHETAERHHLTVWRVRALHELGTIDLFRDGDVTRLEEARDLSLAVGALATAAVLENQICGSLVLGDDPEQALAGACRAAELAEKYGLGQTLAVALGFQAMAHARAGRHHEMENSLRDAVTHAGGDPSMAVIAACARAMLAFLEDDRAAALRQLDDPDVATQGPIPGWRGLLCALNPSIGDAVVASVHAHGEPVHFLARAYLRYADAVVQGRAGRGDEAASSVEAADQLLTRFTWARHHARFLVAEAALADGWGDPEAWLREGEAFFEARGDASLAMACRLLLRKAGVRVPRRRRGATDVPPALRALGVTPREVEVLALVGEGLSNAEIADRLYISPRTVEKHVEHLMAKADASHRRALARLAERLRT